MPIPFRVKQSYPEIPIYIPGLKPIVPNAVYGTIIKYLDNPEVYIDLAAFINQRLPTTDEILEYLQRTIHTSSENETVHQTKIKFHFDQLPKHLQARIKKGRKKTIDQLGMILDPMIEMSEKNLGIKRGNNLLSLYNACVPTTLFEQLRAEEQKHVLMEDRAMTYIRGLIKERKSIYAEMINLEFVGDIPISPDGLREGLLERGDYVKLVGKIYRPLYADRQHKKVVNTAEKWKADALETGLEILVKCEEKRLIPK